MDSTLCPLVSIIIITCNRPFLLKHCLEHVFAQQYAAKEVIVVDSSADDESERALALYADVQVVRLRGQRNNMPRARNAGIAVSSGDILAFIDDDSMVQDGWLEALARVYDEPNVGATGGRVIGTPEPYCDQVSGSPQLVVSRTGRVIGCNMSFRRAALEAVGGFDMHYTLTNLREETDLCVRIKKAGWRIVFEPAMAVVHFSARSLQPYFLERPLVQFSNGRNCMYFAIKHFGLNPRTLAGQWLDMFRSCTRSAYFVGLFLLGIVAHIVGRMVGLGAGIYWMMRRCR